MQVGIYRSVSIHLQVCTSTWNNNNKAFIKLVRGKWTSAIQSKKCVKMFVYLPIVLFYCYPHVNCHSRHYHWRQYTRYSRSWMGHVTLSVETTILVPYLVVESRRRSWGAGARGIHLRVPDPQVGWTSIRVYPGVSGRVTRPAVAVVIVIITTLSQRMRFPATTVWCFYWALM